MVSITNYKMEDGTNVNMSLNFGLLYKLRAESRDTYNALNKVLVNGQKDILETIDLLYGAYRAANLKKFMSRKEFEENMNQDFAYNNQILARLTTGRKK